MPNIDDINPDTEEFQRYRLYFRKNPNSLWAGEGYWHAIRVMHRANELKLPIEQTYLRPDVTFELTAWVDVTTDNVLMKAYLRDNMDGPVEKRGPEYALGCAIPRTAMRDYGESMMDALIVKNWNELASAVWERPHSYRKSEGGSIQIIGGRPSILGLS